MRILTLDRSLAWQPQSMCMAISLTVTNLYVFIVLLILCSKGGRASTDDQWRLSLVMMDWRSLRMYSSDLAGMFCRSSSFSCRMSTSGQQLSSLLTPLSSSLPQRVLTFFYTCGFYCRNLRRRRRSLLISLLIIIVSISQLALLRLWEGFDSLSSVNILKFFNLFFSKFSRMPFILSTLASPRSIKSYIMSSTLSARDGCLSWANICLEGGASRSCYWSQANDVYAGSVLIFWECAFCLNSELLWIEVVVTEGRVGLWVD